MRIQIIAITLIASPVFAEEALPLQRGEFSIRGQITRAITGADIVVGGKSVHLEGTRAPKRGRICIRGGESVDIGTEVAEGFARKIVGAEANIQAHTDESGRLVGRGTVNGEDIGEIAVANGFAVSKIGDFTYAKQEREARNIRPGLWTCSSFPKDEKQPEVATIAPAPQPLPPPMEVKPPPSPKSRSSMEYAPPDASLPMQPAEPEDDFDLVLDDVGGFFEDVFSGIDQTLRSLFGAPPPQR